MNGRPRRSICFHRNAVLGGIDGLEVSDEVRFAEEAGDRGRQASSVEKIGVHGHHVLEDVTGEAR